jgi:hypothetical protein
MTQPTHCGPLTWLFTFPITFVGHPSSQCYELWTGGLVMTHVPLCIVGYRSLVALNTFVSCTSYWLRFLVRVRGIQRSLRRPPELPHNGVLMLQLTFMNTYTPRNNLALQILAASRCDYGMLPLTNKLLYRLKLCQIINVS